jgi:hypothetical protein
MIEEWGFDSFRASSLSSSENSMSDELSASSWSSAQQEHRHGDGTSTITRSQSFDSVPRVSPPQIESPRHEPTSQYRTQHNIESPRHESIAYSTQTSLASPLSPSQQNTLSKIMSVASSRFSRFTLGRDRDDDSSRAPCKLCYCQDYKSIGQVPPNLNVHSTRSSFP